MTSISMLFNNDIEELETFQEKVKNVKCQNVKCQNICGTQQKLPGQTSQRQPSKYTK